MIRTTSLATLQREQASLPDRTKSITLDCGHVALYTAPVPLVESDAYCRTCGAWTTRVRSDGRAHREPRSRWALSCGHKKCLT